MNTITPVRTTPYYLISATTLLGAFLACLLAGCSDPADSVPKSTTSAARETTPIAAANDFVIRAESTIGFTGSKVTGSHDGGFKKFAGTVKVADGKVVGSSEIKIDMNSTWSDAERLTSHLKSPDFFDVAKHPTATFTVTSIGEANVVTGNLDLHGVTKSISFPAVISVTDTEVQVTAEFAINRKDFNITYPGKPDDLIRDNVILKLNIHATPGEPGQEATLPN